MDIFTPYIYNFLFILLRAGIVVSLLPFFGSRNFPVQFKIGFIVAIALILTPVVELNVSKTGIPFVVMREAIIGIILGLTARFIFLAVEMAGQVISNAMGLSIAAIFDPDFGESTQIARFYGMAAMLIFLSMDAHHDLIYVFVKSYEWLPGGQISVKDLIPEVISVSGEMFLIALKISAPVVIAMLISHLLLGFIYKAAPQMNIFFIGYPVYIFVGFVVILMGIPVLTQVIGGYMNGIKDEMVRIIAIARG
ncbi:MAG: flagellar biosynthetic protein FliR [Nitrospirae bacterium RBG_13_43_8]|nr:MAG: flagellar biosynthetic protein FliR [Nitrospirae bacterium RBG_13_43_8]